MHGFFLLCASHLSGRRLPGARIYKKVLAHQAHPAHLFWTKVIDQPLFTFLHVAFLVASLFWKRWFYMCGRRSMQRNQLPCKMGGKKRPRGACSTGPKMQPTPTPFRKSHSKDDALYDGVLFVGRRDVYTTLRPKRHKFTARCKP